MIGHFLGVDHIGHRFGIEHPEMKQKIEQMNRALEDTIQWADSTSKAGRGETMVLFFGDHGQTISGDHGGATREEVVPAQCLALPREEAVSLPRDRQCPDRRVQIELRKTKKKEEKEN